MRCSVIERRSGSNQSSGKANERRKPGLILRRYGLRKGDAAVRYPCRSQPDDDGKQCRDDEGIDPDPQPYKQAQCGPAPAQLPLIGSLTLAARQGEGSE